MTALLLRPKPGEDFVGFVSRQARYVGVHPNQLRSRLGLPRETSARWPSLKQMIEAGRSLQMDEATVTDMTLHRYPRELHELPVNGLFGGARKQWVMNPSGRTCVKCLEERPEMILRDWSIGTSFACSKHQVLLDDHCRLCHPLTKYGPVPARCRCAQRATSPEIRHQRPISPSVLHGQQRLDTLLTTSRQSAHARDKLILTLHWMTVLARAGDATWPPEDDAVTRNLRARIHIEVDRKERKSGKNVTSTTRIYRTSHVVAAYAGAALGAADLSIPDALELYGKIDARQRERNRPTFENSHLLRHLKSSERAERRQTRVELATDFREASRQIADTLNAHDLSIEYVPALLPPPHAQDLVEQTHLLVGQRLAVLAVAHLGDIPKTHAAAYLGVARSIAMGLSGAGVRSRRLLEQARHVADLLVDQPQNYAQLREQFQEPPRIPTRELSEILTSERGLQLAHLDSMTAVRLWCWWQVTGSPPTHRLPQSPRGGVWSDVRLLDAHLTCIKARQDVLALAEGTLHEHQASSA